MAPRLSEVFRISFHRVCTVIFLFFVVRTWGIRTGSLDPIFPSWREMYLNRPRVNFNGVYISKVSYVRHGEASFQDQFYRPYHLVIYYRLIRFFSDGK